MNKVIGFLIIMLVFCGAIGYSNETNFVLIPSGTFERKDNAGNIQKVSVSAFQISDTLVTIQEWRSFLEEKYPDTVDYWERKVRYQVNSDYAVKEISDNWPAFIMTWYQIIEYCNWMSTKDGLEQAYTYTKNTWGDIKDVQWNIQANGYRLPTEAEWELASGIPTATVTEEEYIENSWAVKKVAFDSMPYDVRQKKPNQYGIYDMSGIVSQYCWDYYHEKYYLSNETTDPKGPEQFFVSGYRDQTEEVRVARGGTWYSSAIDLIKYPRGIGFARRNNALIGFRLAKNR